MSLQPAVGVDASVEVYDAVRVVGGQHEPYPAVFVFLFGSESRLVAAPRDRARRRGGALVRGSIGSLAGFLPARSESRQHTQWLPPVAKLRGRFSIAFSSWALAYPLPRIRS